MFYLTLVLQLAALNHFLSQYLLSSFLCLLPFLDAYVTFVLTPQANSPLQVIMNSSLPKLRTPNYLFFLSSSWHRQQHFPLVTHLLLASMKLHFLPNHVFLNHTPFPLKDSNPLLVSLSPFRRLLWYHFNYHIQIIGSKIYSLVPSFGQLAPYLEQPDGYFYLVHQLSLKLSALCSKYTLSYFCQNHQESLKLKRPGFYSDFSFSFPHTY